MTLTGTLKSQIKRLIASLCYRTGVLWLLAWHRLRGAQGGRPDPLMGPYLIRNSSIIAPEAIEAAGQIP